MSTSMYVALAIVVLVFIVLMKTAIVVPQQSAFVVETLGRFSRTIQANVVSELDHASASWGVKVLRYEIKNITPPKDVLHAMEKQMRAEREKRAVVLTSEGDRDAKINQAEGEKQRVIKESEANKQQQINEAEGQAA